MRLCLDEHYSARIAVELRSRGRDALAVQEGAELRSLADGELWAHLRSAKRALLTENVADFVPLSQQAGSAGEDHYGLIFSSPRSFGRGQGTIGVFVERLDELMRSHPGDDGFVNRVHWLQP